MSRGQEIDKEDLATQFKDHVATYEKIHCIDGTIMERLLWAKPDTSCFSMEYIRKNGILYVSGDLGFASYWWSGSNSLKWISKCDIGYFAGKCEASENGRSFTVWDCDKAVEYIKEYISDQDDYFGEPGKSKEVMAKFEEAQGFDAVCSEYEWIAWCYEYAQDIFGDDWGESLGNIGMVLNIRCKYHLEGLKIAMAQLGEEDPYYAEPEKPEGLLVRLIRTLSTGGDKVVQKNCVVHGNMAGRDLNIKK